MSLLSKLQYQQQVFQTLANINYNTVIREILERNEHKILQLNEKQLRTEGVDIEGKKIKRKGADYYPYSDMYLPQKTKQLGSNPTYVDLFKTGEFIRSFHVTFENNEFSISAGEVQTSPDPEELDYSPQSLTNILRYYYGGKKGFEGLTSESIKELSIIVYNEIKEYIYNEFQRLMH